MESRSGTKRLCAAIERQDTEMRSLVTIRAVTGRKAGQQRPKASMNMSFDPRNPQEQAKQARKRIAKLRASASPPAEEIARLEGEASALDSLAVQMFAAEQEEMELIVARGHVVGPELHGETSDQARVRDFYAYLKGGDIRNASLSSTDANGGYLIPEPLHAELMELTRSVDPILERCGKMDMSGGADTLMLPYKSAHGVAATATETGARAEQNAPTLASPTLVAYDYFTSQYATQTWLDSVPGAEELLVRWCFEDVMDKVAVDAAVGTGSISCKGLFAETDLFDAHLSGSAGAVVNTNFNLLYYSMAAKYRKNAVWLMNAATMSVVAGFAHPAATDTLLMKQDVDPPTIFGRPVLECSSAPAIGAANHPIAFVDLANAYILGTHRQIGILRDDYTVTPKIRFYALARIGGCGWDPAACHLLKSNNS